MPKKLIEVAIPLSDISEATAREKRTTARLAHPANIHLWWARRPLAASRAVVFAQLVDDPSEHPERFPTPEAVEAERERLFELMRRLVDPAGPDPQTLADAHAEIRTSVGDDITVVDPFAGGGSIPIEAQRLGLKVGASDLNPVAVLLNRVLLDQVQVALDRPSVHPLEGQLNRPAGAGLSGLADDLIWYGTWLRDQVEEEVGHLYPAITDDADRRLTPVAWLWARTTPCPNPACGIDAPLVRSFVVCKKQGRETWIDPVTAGPGSPVNFEIRPGKSPRLAGTVGRNGAVCVACQTAIPLSQIRKEAQEGRMGRRLMAIVALGDRRRQYLAASDEHEQAGMITATDVLGTELPVQALGFRVQAYGMTTHAALFSGRQLRTLAALADHLARVREQVLADSGGDVVYADLVVTLLGIAISKLVGYANSLCPWLIEDEVPRQIFARQAVPMVWDFAESAPLGDASGSLKVTVANVARNLAGKLCAYQRGSSIAEQANAATRSYPDGVVISTDPPYFDNIGYADLADFYYVWLRLGLRDLHPDLFETMLTPKAEELIATPYRFGGNQQEANEHFEGGFREVFAHIKEKHHPDVPMTVFYAYKQEDDEGNDRSAGASGAGATGWEKLLQGMVDTGLQVTATWPIRTEMTNRMVGRGTNALASSVVLACRPRPVTAGVTDRQGFLRHLRRELEAKIAELQSGGVQPVDMAQASIGPGMAVFTSYAKVVEGGDRVMSVGTALQLINQVLDELQSDQEAEFDSDTRWAVSWFDQHGMNSGASGDALNVANARGTALNALERSGIVEARAGRVRLIDRSEYADDWDPTTDERLTVWEVCQHLIRRVQGDGGLMAAAALLRQVGGLGDAARDLAYRLYEIANRNGWADEARAYNNLAAEWPDLVALAAQPSATPDALF